METKLCHTWQEIEASIDWLISESSLNCGFKFRHPTIKNLRSKQLGKYRSISQEYLTHLGFTVDYDKLQITGLSPNEQKLLDHFLAKRGQTVKFEDIADIIWPKNENWTLYAIVKAIERLRAKIKQSGINLPVIHTHRKVGYSLI